MNRGIDFVGHVIKPWRRTTRPRTLRTALQRIETLPAADLYATGNSYFGLVRQAGASYQEQGEIARAMLKRGHAVDGHLTKAFRRAGKARAGHQCEHPGCTARQYAVGRWLDQGVHQPGTHPLAPATHRQRST